MRNSETKYPIWTMQQRLAKAKQTLADLSDKIASDHRRRDDEMWREIDGALTEAMNWIDSADKGMLQVREFNKQLEAQKK